MTDSGACVGCTDAEQAAAKRDHDNGELLLKSIGRFGLEHYGLENFQRTDENETAFVLAEQFDPLKDNLYMWGACGVGKTHLAGAIFKAAAAGGFRLRWTDPIYLARGTRGRFGNEDESFIADVAATDVLVIDDLGIGRDNATILQTVYEILKIRRNAQRNGLIITSNHSLDELSKKYGDDRFASRVSGMCAVVKMSGNDRRFSSKT